MGSSLVVVAIPEETDYVHKISSEPVPHLTLLYLGDASKVQNLSGILNFVHHASSMFPRFGLDMDRRGILGDDQADVLFFTERSTKDLGEFRSQLLKDSAIATAYSSVDQFPVWKPHLTLGYPATPAHEDDREYGGIHWVSFDRIAVWFGDYEGVEFPLERHEWETDFAMSDIRMLDDGEKAVAEILHYGKKGMKWGQRNAKPSANEIHKARERVSGTKKELASKKNSSEYSKMRADFLKSPDRATALRLTTGEKWVTAALGLTVPVAGTAGALGFAGSRVARRRATERRIREA